MSMGNASPLYIKVKTSILGKIRNHFWLVDQQIPTEQELMDQYQVGRETIRKAVEQLVTEGYLYKKRGIGTFVKNNLPTLTLEPLVSLSNLFASRGNSETNYIVKKESLVVDELLHQLTEIPLGENILYINRKRSVDGMVIALEHAYFIHTDVSESYDFHNSIAKYLFDHIKLHLYKINHTITKRKPSEEECILLEISNDIDIIELERWSYMEEAEGVYFYVKLIILTDIYSYSF
jgi:GntR family transcriptional regulator